MIYKANDLYSANLSAGYTAGQGTMPVTAVPANVPTVITLAKGTDKEATYAVTGKTASDLTGVVRLRGYTGNFDANTAITCLNNEEFLNQYYDLYIQSFTETGGLRPKDWIYDTYAASIEFNLDDGVEGGGKKHRVELTGNAVLSLDGESAGDIFIVRLLQGTGGNKTVTWWDGIDWADGVAPVLSTTAGKADVFGFIRTGVGTYDGFIIGQNL